MTRQEIDKIRTDINTAAFRQKRKCFITGCDQMAIQSHLIQKKGILKNITVHGHLYEVAFLQFPKSHYNFKKIGWNNVLTFPGFCSHHDSEIFTSIENRSSLDLADYRTMLLLSYRPLLHEYREKEKVIEAIRNTMLHEKFFGLADVPEMKNLIAGESILQWDIEFMLLCLQEDLTGNSEQYKFVSIVLPKVDVCTFSIISHASLGESFLTDPIDLTKKEPIAGILFHLIPTPVDTKLILGYHITSENRVKDRVLHLQSLPISVLLKEISDMLIKNCGTWACSEKFYMENIKPRKNAILNLMNYFVRRKQFSKEPIELNLFEH